MYVEGVVHCQFLLRKGLSLTLAEKECEEPGVQKRGAISESARCPECRGETEGGWEEAAEDGEGKKEDTCTKVSKHETLWNGGSMLR